MIETENAPCNALSLRLADLERKVNYILKTFNLDYREEPLTPALAVARDLLRQGRKLEAISNYARQVGVGQREAQEIIDLLQEWLLG